MRLPILFAWRYIFSKKSTNAINIISGVSVLGIALGSMALVVIMSVFNGFEDVLRDLISKFKPDIHVSVAEGKTFTIDSNKIAQIKQLTAVEMVAQTLEEVALFEYDGVQNLARLKGVDNNFVDVIDLDTMLQSGRYRIYDADTDINFAVVGVNLEASMGISSERSDNEPLTVYMPKRGASKWVGNAKPFKQRDVFPSAIYSVKQAEYDNHVITNLAFVQDLLTYQAGEISAIEIKLKADADVEAAKQAIQNIVGTGFLVKNRYEQDEAFFKITNLEKWVGYIIFAFTLVLVAFNMVGALWMLVLEKHKDIATLKALGADNRLIQRIFLLEGALLSAIGVSVGCIVGAALCILQQQFGFIRLGDGSNTGAFIIDAYPVSMRFTDFIVVIATVLSIGTLAAWIPALRASRVEGIVRND